MFDTKIQNFTPRARIFIGLIKRQLNRNWNIAALSKSRASFNKTGQCLSAVILTGCADTLLRRLFCQGLYVSFVFSSNCRISPFWLFFKWAGHSFSADVFCSLFCLGRPLFFRPLLWLGFIFTISFLWSFFWLGWLVYSEKNASSNGGQLLGNYHRSVIICEQLSRNLCSSWTSFFIAIILTDLSICSIFYVSVIQHFKNVKN